MSTERHEIFHWKDTISAINLSPISLARPYLTYLMKITDGS